MKRRERDSIFDKNNFWLGFVIGLCLPVAAYGIFLTFADFIDTQFLPPDTSISRGFRERTLSVIAICCNLIPFHIYNRRYAPNTMRGMIFPTMGFVALWFWLYGRHMVGLS
jgi:hypothetical protein